MDQSKPKKALTRSETQWLSEFLLSDDNGGPSMFIDEVDGLFACLHCSPESMGPSQWMPTLWRGAEPEFTSKDEAERFIGLLMTMWNETGTAIRAKRYRPMISGQKTPEDEMRDCAIGWAKGFIDGMKLQMKYWGDTEDDALVLLLAPILALAREGRIDCDEVLGDEKRDDLIAALPAAVTSLQEFWREKVPLESLYGPRPGGSTTPKPAAGRNEPCPCGSGKKYKKCCGSPQAHDKSDGTVH